MSAASAAPRAEERLLLLFRAALRPEEEVSAPPPPLSPVEEGRLYALAKKQDIDHLILSAAERLGTEICDPYREKYQKRMLLSIYRDERMRLSLERIETALGEARIPYLPLKGAVIRDMYPESWLRTSCDIDILVREEDVDRAILALLPVGYRAEEKRNYHDVHLTSEEGPLLELHFHIGEDMPTLDRVLCRVWEYAAPESEGSVRYRMTPAFQIFHLIAHAAYHFLHGGCGIRPFADLYLYRRQVTYDERELDALLEEAGLVAFADASFRLAAYWFGEGEEDADGLFLSMRDFLLGGGIYGTRAQSIAVENSARGGRVGFLFRRLFPPLRRISVRYPVLKKHPWLLPFCYVRRFFGLFERDRRERTAKTLRAAGGLDTDALARTSEMLERIGLRDLS